MALPASVGPTSRSRTVAGVFRRHCQSVVSLLPNVLLKPSSSTCQRPRSKTSHARSCLPMASTVWLRREYLLLAAHLCRKHTPTLLRRCRFGIQPLGRYASTSTVLSVPRFLALVCWFVSFSINRSSSSSISIHSLTAAATAATAAAAAAAGGVAMV